MLQALILSAVILAAPPNPVLVWPGPDLSAAIEEAVDHSETFCGELLEDHPFPERVDRWCVLVNAHFGDEWTHWALHIIECESGGRPDAKNRNSSASGLFQHLARYWDRRSAKAGWEGADVFDPEANIAVAAWLFNDGRGRSHWVCKARR